MPNYRRLYRPGGTYFFTVNLRDRRRTLLTDHFDQLITVFADMAERRPYQMLSYVVLPDHIHCIWQLPDDDADFSVRWRLIKTGFSKSLRKDMTSGLETGAKNKSIWQRRFWEHLIRDDEDLNNHMAYIRKNPVKHGYVDDPDDWRYAHWHRPIL